MAVMDSAWGSTHLMRNEVFSAQLKEMFQDETIARGLVNWTNELPDGVNLKINSIGDLVLDEAAESTPLPERRMETGQFIFNIDEYQGAKVAFTDENLIDNFMAPQAVAATPAKMMRAFEEVLESKIFSTVNKVNGQAKNSSNEINGYKHRMVASGATRAISLADFAYAKLALQKANVPMNNLVAFVDPATAFQLDTMTNIIDVSNNPQWQGIVETGMGTGTRFVRNIYGFDVYTSNYLDTATAAESALTKYDGTTVASAVGDKMALFFANLGGYDSPFLGAFREDPFITSWRDDSIRTEYHEMRARYGVSLFRPENMVTIWHNPIVA